MEIFKFEGNEVRFVGTFEDPEWVGLDICNVLGIANPSDALGRLEDYQKGSKPITDSIGRTRMTDTVKEAGLYALIMTSRKENAKRFQRWVFEEVIPSIRKTGRYEINQKKGRGAYWYERTKIATSSDWRPLPLGYFSIFIEMMNFFSQLESQLSYTMPDYNLETEEHIVPDISIGLGFNEFLRSDGNLEKRIRLEFLGSEDIIDFRSMGKNNREIEKYEHIYPASSHGVNNKKEVNAYPNKYRNIFLYYLENIWIPNRFHAYIGERDKEGYKNLRAMIVKLSDSRKIILQNTILKGVVQLLLQEGLE